MPYTYLITHISTGLKYYGVRYAKNSQPDDLWTTYFTSSRQIKRMIAESGKEAFVAEVRKIFDTAEQAIAWETRVLIRLRIPYNKRYINKCKNHPLSQMDKEELMHIKYGVRYPAHHPDLMKKAKKSMIEKYGVEHPCHSPIIKEKTKNTLNEKYGVDCSWQIPGVFEKSKKTRMDRLGVEFSMQSSDLVEQSKNTQIEKFGDWKIRTSEVQEKIKKTNIEKYGTDNPFKVPGLVKEIMVEKYGVENWSQTEEGKKAITDSWTKRIPMVCPHCGKESKAFSNMKRWHFNNCKKNINE